MYTVKELRALMASLPEDTIIHDLYFSTNPTKSVKMTLSPATQPKEELD